MGMRYVQTGNDEDGNPVYEYVDDGESGNESLFSFPMVNSNAANSGMDFAFGAENSSGAITPRGINDFSGTESAYGLDPSKFTVVGIDEFGEPIVVARDPGVILNPDGTPSGGSGTGAVTGTGGNASIGSSAPKPGSSASNAVKKFFSGDSSTGTYVGAGLGLLGLLEAYQKNKQREANQVTQVPLNLNKYKYVSGGTNRPAPRAYGAGAMGQNYGGALVPTSQAVTAPVTAPVAAPAAAPVSNVAYPVSTMPYRSTDATSVKPVDSVSYDPISGSLIEDKSFYSNPSVVDLPVRAASGGLMELAKGGSTNYLRGKTDGMADKLNTSIDGIQPAKLSHGEFVVPADVVAHLGNGNSEAGADVLYKMLDRVRRARTGNKKQGKKINPNKFMPGGIASLNNYAEGGQVAFAEGGPTSPGTVSSTLSPWVQPYVGNMLEKGFALADKPYEAYGGQLTAGTSPLQQQAFNTASNLAVPGSVGDATKTLGNISTNLSNLKYTPTQATNQFTAPNKYQTSNIGIDQFNTSAMQQYMNPYMQMALDPQIAEARRQSEITQMGNASKLAQAGAYGGSRGALMQSEAQRNLGTNLANITGQGYNTAYDKAMDAFNKQQDAGLRAKLANEQSSQFGATQGMTAAQSTAQYGQDAQKQNADQQKYAADYGLLSLRDQANAANLQGNLGIQQNQAGISNLVSQLNAGATQSTIEQAALDAERGQYQESQLYPYKQLQFQQSLLTGLPASSSTATGSGSIFSDLASGIGGILKTQELVDGVVKPK
jgi:hypothetical protein